MSEINEKENKKENEAQRTREALKKMMKEGKLPNARPMTRGERRELDKAGLNIRKIDYEKQRIEITLDDMADWITDHVYPDFNFDNLPNNTVTIFAMYIFQITYEDSLAEKN